MDMIDGVTLDPLRTFIAAVDEGSRILVKALNEVAREMDKQVIAEWVALAAFFGVAIVADWRGFVCFYVPVWYLGQMAALAENYLEHHGAIPGDRRTDSDIVLSRVAMQQDLERRE